MYTHVRRYSLTREERRREARRANLACLGFGLAIALATVLTLVLEGWH